MSFGSNLKIVREKQGYSMAELSKYLDINMSTYRNYETRNSLPPEKIIIKIAKHLSVTTDELFGYKLPEKKISEIEYALDCLTECGFKCKWDKEHKEVTISANHDIANVPESVIICLVKNTKENINSTIFDIYKALLYREIMQNVITYGETGTCQEVPKKVVKKRNKH